MATNEIIFTIGTDTGDSAAEVQQMQQALEDVNEELQEVGQNTGKALGDLEQEAKEAAKALESPATRLEQMRNEMIRIGQADPRFQELAAEAGQLQDEINNATAAVNAMANDYPELQVGVQALSSVGAAAQGATAAQALLGEENEDVAKSIQKLLAIQSLMNSVQTIANQLSDETALGLRVRAIRQNILTSATEAQTVATGQQTIAQRALNLVMNANPVFLIITGFIALGAAFVALTTNIKEARTEQELLNEAQEAAIDDIAKETSELQDLTNVLKSETATREQKAQAIEDLNKKYPEFLGNIDEEKVTQEELNEAIEKQTELINLQAEAKALAAIRAELFKEKLELEMEAQRALTDESFKWQEVIGQGNLARQTEQKERQLRISTIEEEIAATQKATEANRAEENSLLSGVNARNQLAASMERLGELNKDQISSVQKQVKNQEALRKEREKAHQEYLKQLEQEEKELKERTQLLEDLLITNIKDVNHRRIVELQQQQLRERQQLEEKYAGDTDLLKQLEIKQARELADLQREIREEAEAQVAEENNARREQENADNKAALEARLIQMQEDFAVVQQLKIQQAQQERDQALQDTELTENQKLLIQEQFADKVRAINQETADKEKQLRKDVEQAGIDIAAQGVEAIGALSDAVFAIKANNLKKGSAEEERAAKKQFEINKKVQIASAIISGINGVINTLSAVSVIPEPLGSIQKGITAAIIAASTVANIAKIKATTFQSSGGGAGIGAPSLQPTVNADSIDVDGAIGEGGTTLTGTPTTTPPPAQQVVIVDSEIKASQDRIADVEQTSTIG